MNWWMKEETEKEDGEWLGGDDAAEDAKPADEAGPREETSILPKNSSTHERQSKAEEE
jgi:hypothetical protein